MPEDLPADARRDLLAYAAFRIAPPAPPPPRNDLVDRILVFLREGVDTAGPTIAPDLERRFVDRLVPSVGIPLEVKVFSRRGSIELAVLILGSYALLKDYKPLRDSLDLLVQDIKNVLSSVPGGFHIYDWDVEVVDFRTPGTTAPETVGGFAGGVVSRYGLLYLLIINFLERLSWLLSH
jgi:hypothetical protein